MTLLRCLVPRPQVNYIVDAIHLVFMEVVIFASVLFACGPF